MTSTHEPNSWKRDLIDRIADALPQDVRAEYYRIMGRLESLSENDELLVILRALQLIALVIVQTPDRILAEREHYERICTETTRNAETIREATKDLARSIEKTKMAIEEPKTEIASAPTPPEEGAEDIDRSHDRSHAIVLTLMAFVFLAPLLFMGWMLFASGQASETETAPAPAIQAVPSAPASPSRRK
jgi:hypothetical protein